MTRTKYAYFSLDFRNLLFCRCKLAGLFMFELLLWILGNFVLFSVQLSVNLSLDLSENLSEKLSEVCYHSTFDLTFDLSYYRVRCAFSPFAGVSEISLFLSEAKLAAFCFPFVCSLQNGLTKNKLPPEIYSLGLGLPLPLKGKL